METDRDRIVQVFQQFGVHGGKSIEWERLMKAMKMLNPSYADGLAEQALLAEGKLRDGKIDYEEFVDWAFGPAEKSNSEEATKNAALDAEEAQKMAAMKGKTRRAGVAAESVSTEVMDNYVKPVYPKDGVATALIMKTLTENEKMKVLCGHLEGKSLDDLINAFYCKEFKEGEDIIRQGNDGDCLYIIAEGTVDIFVARPNSSGSVDPGDRGTKVVSFGPGVLFGELALLYSAPRAATVCVATPAVKLWTLDQLDFKMLLAQSAAQTLALYEGWLRSVDILKMLNDYEVSRLSECLENQLFDDGEVIIKQGDPGNDFFILEDGTCAAYIQGDSGEIEVKKYEKQGEYFGELALLTEAPRKATIRATGNGCVVASFNRDVFDDILGPLSDMMRTQSDKYPQYSQFLAK